jgi:hypothetical protein
MPRIPLHIESLIAGGAPRRFGARELKVIEALQQDNNVDEAFDAPLLWSAVDQEGGLVNTATPAAGDEVTFNTRKHRFLCHVQSINGTAVQSFPFTSADGLEVNVDDDATNGILGWEITNGILANSYAAYTVGSFPETKKIYFETTLKIDDISDVTELAMGFRKAEAFQANVDDYAEMASFNVGQDGDGQIEIHTILNGAATTETDTTETDWADTNEKTLRVEVTNDGVCTFKIDGAAPTVTATFTFDSGEVIVPFFFLIAETGDPGVSISSWECGIE